MDDRTLTEPNSFFHERGSPCPTIICNFITISFRWLEQRGEDYLHGVKVNSPEVRSPFLKKKNCNF